MTEVGRAGMGRRISSMEVLKIVKNPSRSCSIGGEGVGAAAAAAAAVIAGRPEIMERGMVAGAIIPVGPVTPSEIAEREGVSSSCPRVRWSPKLLYERRNISRTDEEDEDVGSSNRWVHWIGKDT